MYVVVFFKVPTHPSHTTSDTSETDLLDRYSLVFYIHLKQWKSSRGATVLPAVEEAERSRQEAEEVNSPLVEVAHLMIVITAR